MNVGYFIKHYYKLPCHLWRGLFESSKMDFIKPYVLLMINPQLKSFRNSGQVAVIEFR